MNLHIGKVVESGHWAKRPKFWSLIATGAVVLAACGSSSSTTASSTNSSAPATTSSGSSSPGSSSSGSSSTTSAAPIKVGVMTNDTGPYAALGAPLRDGVQMVFDQINQAGGINGHKIDVIALDGKTDPNTAVTEAHQLVADHVAVVTGLEFSTAAKAVAPIFEAAHIPMIATAADDTLVNPVNPWLFEVTTSTYLTDQKMLSYFACKGITKIASLHDNEALGVQGNADLAKLAAGTKVSIVGTQTYDLTGTNFETQLLALNSTPAQAIVYWGVGTAPVVVVKEHSALGIKAPLVGSAANTDSSFLSQVPGAVNGMIDATVPADLLKNEPSSVTDGAAIQSFATAYTAKYKIPFGMFSSFGHDQAETIAALIKGGATTSQEMQAALNNNFQLNDAFTGVVRFTPTNHLGVTLSDLFMARIVNGEAVPTKCQ